MTESWARTSLRITADGLTSSEISRALGRPSEPGSSQHWLRSFESSSSEPLELQLLRLADFVKELPELARELQTDYEVDVLISWTPHPGQDGLAIGQNLVAALAKVGATILIDTYDDR